jgi:hypothetical protein
MEIIKLAVSGWFARALAVRARACSDGRHCLGPLNESARLHSINDPEIVL